MLSPERLGATDLSSRPTGKQLVQWEDVSFGGSSQVQILDLLFPGGKLFNLVGQILFSLRPSFLTCKMIISCFIH